MRRYHLLILTSAAIIYPACHGGDLSGPPENPIWRGCSLQPTDWPGGDFDIQTDMALGCPLRLQSEGQWVNFGGVAHWPTTGYVVYGVTGFYYLDGNYNVQGGAYYPAWNLDGTGGYVMQFTGSYRAALAGFQVLNNADALSFTFQRAQGSPQYGKMSFIAAYGFGNPMRLTAPEAVDPYTYFRVNADLLDPTFVPPVTYTWTDNDNPLSYDSDYFDFFSGEGGVNHTFQVTISDSQGHSTSQSYMVHVRTCYAPCNES